MTHEDDRGNGPQEPGPSGGWSAPGGGTPSGGPPSGPPPGGPQGPAPDQGPPPGQGHGQGPPQFGPPPGQEPVQGPPPGQGQAHGQGPPQFGPPPGQGTPQGHGQGPPQFGPPPGPGQGQAQGAAHYGPPPGHGGGPPKPGLVPLHPLGLGDILNGAFALIRNHPATTFGLAFVVMAISSIITALLSSGAMAEMDRFLEQAAADPSVLQDGPVSPVSGGSLVLMLLGSGVSYFALSILTALLTSVVGMAVLGHKYTVAQVWAVVRGRIWPILGLAVLQYLINFALAMVITATTLLGVAFGLFLSATGAQTAGMIVMVLGTLLGLVGGLALFAWVSIRIFLAMPVLVLEHLGPGRALARSWRLTQGNWWRMFGIVLLTLIIVAAVGLVLGLATGLLGSLPLVLAGDADWAMVVTNALGVVLEALVYSITMPFLAAVTTLLYIDLRMRREGLDLHLHNIAQQGLSVGPEIYRPEPRA